MSLKRGTRLYEGASVENGSKTLILLENKNKAQKLFSKSVGSPHVDPLNQAEGSLGFE